MVTFNEISQSIIHFEMCNTKNRKVESKILDKGRFKTQMYIYPA